MLEPPMPLPAIQDRCQYTTLLRRWGVRRRLKPGQYRLSALLICLTLCSAVFGMLTWNKDRWLLPLIVEDLGGHVEPIRWDRTRLGVDLSNTAISDDDLRRLIEVPRVRRINLNSTAVTDRGMDYLAQMPDLRVIILDNTEVSEQAVRELLRARPGIVVWRQGRVHLRHSYPADRHESRLAW
jgi:hypothetical protein